MWEIKVIVELVIDGSRIICGLEEETISHLFGKCSFTTNVWLKVYNWIGGELELSISELKSFFFYFEKVKCKTRRTQVAVIWLAMVWNIWLVHDAVIFKGVDVNFDDCIREIVFGSWIWLISSFKLQKVVIFLSEILYISYVLESKDFPCCTIGWNISYTLSFNSKLHIKNTQLRLQIGSRLKRKKA